MTSLRSLAISLLIIPLIAMAQSAPLDLADRALVTEFQANNGNVLCSPKDSSLKEMRALFDPFIKGIDLANQASYPALAVAVYTAFPCPFSPLRPELRPSAKEDFVGSWLFPDTSVRLRHGPKSPAWKETSGMPTIKCEGVAFYDSGEYRVAQIRGQFACPTEKDMQAMRSMPKVSSWAVLPNGRVKISRTDVPAQFEEWEIYTVQTPFEVSSFKFAVGDLVAYLRRQPGNEINATSTFRHLQPLK